MDRPIDRSSLKINVSRKMMCASHYFLKEPQSEGVRPSKRYCDHSFSIGSYILDRQMIVEICENVSWNE